MKRHHKLTSQEQNQQHTAERQTPETVREFATAEELLRHDALHTPVPPKIAYRLRDSLGQSPPPASRWWRRFFGP